MKEPRVRALVFVALIALLLLPLPAVSARATFTPCEGSFVPDEILGFGSWAYPGGRMHLRGMVTLYDQDMPDSDPRCSGWNTVVANANWDANGVGPSWGTFHVAPKDESPFHGGWAGTWTGMSYADGTTSIQVVGHGYGDLDGMQVFVDLEFPGMMLPGVASGYILDPGGQ